MCAIFGTIGKANLELIKEISKKQIYRGPDEQNFFVSDDNLVSIGNNRLSVIDKENGKQPMFSGNKRFVTVFNGCIYNFKEIRKFLETKKVKFTTNSDTEVVANSFERFGIKAFNYFDGMWAIAIYDTEKKDIILSRDYVGQKPLYLSKSNGYYIFSSQLDGILLDKNISRELSNENLKKYFSYSHVPSPGTIFKNVSQVHPGENIIINAKSLNLSKNKYWDLKSGPDYNLFFNKTIKEKFNEDFNIIVKNHTTADKSPALSLSSGIDSYIIMKHLLNFKESLSSFTLGFENKTYDESRHVRKINEKIKKDIFYSNAENLKKSFLEISKYISDPIGDSSILPTFILCQKIRSHSNVVIGGDGGDEAFFGYITFDAFFLARFIKKILPNSFIKIIKKITSRFKISNNYLSVSTKIKKFFNSIHLDYKHLLPSWMCCLSSDDIGKLFNEKTNESELFSESDYLFNDSSSYMKNSQLYYFKYYLPMVLKKVDQASMFNSIESRSPFLSKSIINFSLDQKTGLLYSFFNKKFFLKNTFKNIIPKDILKRKKHGFAFPIEIILRDVDLVKNLIDFSILINREFFDEKYKKFIDKKEDCGAYLWNELILNLSLQNLNKTNSY